MRVARRNHKAVFEVLTGISLVFLLSVFACSVLIESAEAIRATNGNADLVCGDKLCSEIDGGAEVYDAIDSVGQEPEVTLESESEFSVRAEPGFTLGGAIDDWWNKAKSTVSDTFNDVKNDIENTYQTESSAITQAANKLKDATDLVNDEVGAYAKATWQNAQDTAQEGLETAKNDLVDASDTLAYLKEQLKNLDKALLCAEYAAEQCVAEN